MSDSLDAAALRLLRRVSRKGARLVQTGGQWRLAATGERAAACDAAAVTALRGRGLLAPAADGAWTMTTEGAALLRRSLAGGETDYAAQHQDRGAAVVTDDLGAHAVAINHDESPLAWLRRRRDARGQPLVDAVEFAAGERLRADYTRGQIMPRVTSNWSGIGGRGRDGSGVIELTEAAMGARHRVERALQAVGPELSGLLVDFCCFLKGLEEIERERRWPARSAKIALRIGLAALARHYGLSATAQGRAHRGAPLHWGTEDYRPRID